MDCRRPKLQLACAKMVSKTGLLVKLLSEGQDDQSASAVTGQCLLEGNVSNGTAKETGRKFTGKLKAEYTLGDGFPLSMSVSIMIVIILTVICRLEACSQKNAAASQPRSTTKSQPKRFFQKFLPRAWSVEEDGVRAQQERALAQPCDWNAPEEEEEEEMEIFNRAQRR
ncbi:leucine-rich repeat-containing protein 37B [Larus michahellis]|uniref:leucine-rich repeat-containing protein 37B n=1 Tax=Larus michahellis TaxID=119627 RepID=UPI003D9AD533